MKSLFIIVFCALALSGCQTVKNPDVWEASIVRDEQGKVIKRFIPVELFTGADWDGKHILTLSSPVNTSRGRNGWIKTPAIGLRGNTVITRERNSAGKIYQEYEVNKYEDGIEMSYQNRRGRISNDTVTENKFPLGWWHPGESRRYCGKYGSQLTILDIDYGSSHGVKFHWKINCNNECESTYKFFPGSSNSNADLREHPNIKLPNVKRVCDK